MESRVVLSAVFVVACFLAESYAFVASDCKAGNGWSAMVAEEAKASEAPADTIIIDLDADEIVLGKPFSFNLRLCADEEVKPERVTVNATMPAHKHGMNYNPTVVYDEESKSFKVEDFLFHMPGEWEISFSTYQGDDAVHYTKMLTVN